VPPVGGSANGRCAAVGRQEAAPRRADRRRNGLATGLPDQPQAQDDRANHNGALSAQARQRRTRKTTNSVNQFRGQGAQLHRDASSTQGRM